MISSSFSAILSIHSTSTDHTDINMNKNKWGAPSMRKFQVIDKHKGGMCSSALLYTAFQTALVSENTG